MKKIVYKPTRSFRVINYAKIPCFAASEYEYDENLGIFFKNDIVCDMFDTFEECQAYCDKINKYVTKYVNYQVLDGLIRG